MFVFTSKIVEEMRRTHILNVHWIKEWCNVRSNSKPFMTFKLELSLKKLVLGSQRDNDRECSLRSRLHASFEKMEKKKRKKKMEAN